VGKRRLRRGGRLSWRKKGEIVQQKGGRSKRATLDISSEGATRLARDGHELGAARGGFSSLRGAPR